MNLNASYELSREIEVTIGRNTSTFVTEIDVSFNDMLELMRDSGEDMADLIMEIDSMMADLDFTCDLVKRLTEDIISNDDFGEKKNALIREHMDALNKLLKGEDEEDSEPVPVKQAERTQEKKHEQQHRDGNDGNDNND